MINVFLIISFVYVQLSLLATVIQELFAGFVSMRGKMLRRALAKMLNHEQELQSNEKSRASRAKKLIGGVQIKALEQLTKEDHKTFWEKFVTDPFYTQLIHKQLGKIRVPSYLESATFRNILINIIDPDNNDFERIEAAINGIQGNDELKEKLQRLLKEAKREAKSFEEKLEEWYDNMMKRVNGWYKRSTQWTLIVIGLIVAVLFDADSIEMYQKLQVSENLEFYADAIATVAQQESISLEEFDVATDTLFKELKSPLGMDGIGTAFVFELEAGKDSVWTITSLVLLKLLGWLITSLAISLGATFWFDLLKKLINIRNAGNRPRYTANGNDQTQSYNYP